MNKDRLEELEILFDSHLSEPTPRIQKDIFSALSDSKVPLSFKTKAVFYLKTHRKNIDINGLSKALSVNLKTAKEIMENPVSAAYFPISNPEGAELSKLYVIKISDPNPVSTKNGIDKALNVLTNLTGVGFFITFDNDFDGNSFMLAVFAALTFFGEKRLEQYSFSGVADVSGNISEVEFLNKKRAVSLEESKYLIDSTIIDNTNKLKHIIQNQFIDVPFSVAVRLSQKGTTCRDSAISNLNKLTNEIEKEGHIGFKALKNLYGLKDEDFVYYIKESFLPDRDWSNYLKEAYAKIKNLKSKIKDKTAVINFSLLAPSVFAFGLGALIGCKEPFVIYHYNNGEYNKVLDLKDKDERSLKKVCKDTSNLQCDFTKNGKDSAALVYYMGTLNPLGDVKNYISKTIGECDIVHCQLKNKQGNIPVGDWSRYINAMYESYNKTKSESYQKRLFFFSVPVPIAFGFGAAVETFENGDVFNLKKNDTAYVQVFNLKKLAF